MFLFAGGVSFGGDGVGDVVEHPKVASQGSALPALPRYSLACPITFITWSDGVEGVEEATTRR